MIGKWLLLPICISLWTCTDSSKDSTYPYSYHVVVRQDVRDGGFAGEEGGSVVQNLKTGRIYTIRSHIGAPGDTIKVVRLGKYKTRYYRVHNYKQGE